VGQVVPYQFVVTNGGTVPVDDVTIADPLVTDATCPLSTLEPNQTETCTGSYVLTAADLAQGSLENTAVADGTTLNGAVSSPPSSATLGFGPRLALTKAITTAAPYSLGQMLTYRYDVTNTGSVTLAGLNVVDSKIPAGVVCPTTTLTPAPAYGSSESCTASMVLTAAALSPDGTLTNTAYATAASSQGAATSPTATVTVPVAADVGLTKTVDNPAPLLGQTVTFTVTATNYGPATATSLAVSDPLPNGLVFVGANPSEGTYVAATGLWTVGSLAVGAASTLTLQATATVPTTIVNTATVSHLDEPDLTPANDSASAAVSPIQPTADMAVTKTVDNATPTVGDTVTFTVTATNNGPFADPGVALTDTAGPALSVTGGTPSAGSFDPASGVWTLGNVAVGAVATLQVTATVLADGPSTNVVAVTAAGLPDPFPANNSATATIVAQPQTADVGITKVPSTTAPTTTAPFTYTLVAYNDGPDPAADVTATDLLPAGLNYVSSSATLGTYDPTTGVWLLGQLANGQRATLTITVQPTTPESVTNTATITSTTLDPNPGNNSASVAVAVAAVADLAVTKQVSDSRPLHGAEVTYTVTVTDLGPQDATGVALSAPHRGHLRQCRTVAGDLRPGGRDVDGGPTRRRKHRHHQCRCHSQRGRHVHQHRVGLGQRPDRPRPVQQLGVSHHRDATRGRPRRGQDDPGARSAARSGRPLHRDPHQQRPRRGDQRCRDRHHPRRTLLPVGGDQRGHLRRNKRGLERERRDTPWRRGFGHPHLHGDGRCPRPGREHGGDLAQRPVRHQPHRQLVERPDHRVTPRGVGQHHQDRLSAERADRRRDHLHHHRGERGPRPRPRRGGR
jgi:uncharacterized repeat protein (TIGR01451 family)